MGNEKEYDITQEHEITVRLMGKATEIIDQCCDKSAQSRYHEVKVKIPQNRNSLREIVEDLAKSNPLIEDQIIRSDGTPRSSTKILINGKAPKSLEGKVEFKKQRGFKGSVGFVIVIVWDDGTITVITDEPIVIIVVLPCDG